MIEHAVAAKGGCSFQLWLNGIQATVDLHRSSRANVVGNIWYFGGRQGRCKEAIRRAARHNLEFWMDGSLDFRRRWC